jgi:3-oxo-4-pregnene-20-carboxyl-CoA dehydrogenase beta subunit
MVQDQETASNEALSEADRQLLRDSVRDFLAARWPAAHAVEQSGDPEAIARLWRDMSAQSLSSLGAEPAAGGLREIALVFEELGRASCPAPLLGAVTANLALAPRRAASRAAASLLDGIREGTARVAAAYGAFDGDASAGRVQTSGEGDALQLNGRIAFVESAAGATHFLVFADVPAGAAIVAADAAGIAVQETPGLAVPAFAEVSFGQTPARLVRMEAAEIEDIVQAARLACAARAIGAANRAFELAVEHAKVRRQFGQLIGQFQAIQHKLADALISLDGARLALEHAAAERDRGARQWAIFASAALAYTGPALRALAVQIHRALGAIGYAEEHEAPRHFRRVHADLVRLGGAPRARAELADFLLGPAG